MRRINKIILHVADTPDTMDVGFREINEWHKDRGWMDKKSGVSCGYHYIIRRDGTIEQGRPDTSVGSHCYGHNKKSIGICWIGRDEMSIRQNVAMKDLMRYLLTKYKLDAADIKGHNEYNDHKTCPNLNMNTVRWDILLHFNSLEEKDIK